MARPERAWNDDVDDGVAKRNQTGRPRSANDTHSVVAVFLDVHMTQEVRLPQRLDMKAAAELSALFTASRGSAMVLDALDVRYVSALFLQLLIAARRQWAQDGLPFEFRNCSDAFDEGLAALGQDKATLFNAGVPT